jgi:AraC family transcriptional regulator
VELNIKNMVCGRCMKVVKQVVENHNLNIRSIELGKLVVAEELDAKLLEQIRNELREEGFDLVDDQKAKLVTSVKNLIIQKIHYGELDEMKENFSDYLSSSLHKDYTYLSNLFSQMESITIEQFIILQKVEKIKELLIYDEMPISDIAFRLGYSSQAHLSNQFKKITGFSPIQFKKLKDHHRKHLDKLGPVNDVN